MSDWRPIETFFEREESGGQFLIYEPGYGVRIARCEFAGFHIWIDQGGARYFGGAPHNDERPTKSAPTHWMPFPAPPTKQTEPA